MGRVVQYSAYAAKHHTVPIHLKTAVLMQPNLFPIIVNRPRYRPIQLRGAVRSLSDLIGEYNYLQQIQFTLDS